MGDTAIPIRDPIAGLNSILDLYSGKTTKSVTDPETTTESTKSNMTSEQLQSQIDMAMAPLNAASHGAGLSTYSDTNLALGRAQVAGDILAKNAGTTRTVQTSGRTTTQSTPGALSSSRIGDTLGSLAITQLGAPILKKLGQSSALQGLQDSIANTGSSMVDSILGSGSSVMDSVGRVNSSGATDTISAGIDALAGTDLTSAITSGVASSASGGILSSLGDTISQGASDVEDWFKNFFAEGGMVSKNHSYADGGYAETAQDIGGGGGDDGYATGGYIDRPATSSNLEKQSAATPKLDANGAIGVPTVGSSAQDLLLDYVRSVSTGGKMKDPSADNTQATSGAIGAGPQLGAVAPGPMIGQAGLANAGLTALGLAGPLGFFMSKAISAATDTPSLQAMVVNSMRSILGKADPSVGPVNALDAHLALNDNYGTTSGSGGRGQDGGVTGDRGPGGSSGEAGAAAAGASPSGPGNASGGKISGPGTGTSDSIPAKLSDGEYVIDAKTVDALGPEFFQKIQMMFNPEAIQSQVAKGRI